MATTHARTHARIQSSVYGGGKTQSSSQVLRAESCLRADAASPNQRIGIPTAHWATEGNRIKNAQNARGRGWVQYGGENRRERSTPKPHERTVTGPVALLLPLLRSVPRARLTSLLIPTSRYLSDCKLFLVGGCRHLRLCCMYRYRDSHDGSLPRVHTVRS